MHDHQVPASWDKPTNVFLVVDLVGYTDLNIFDDLLLKSLNVTHYTGHA